MHRAIYEFGIQKVVQHSYERCVWCQRAYGKKGESLHEGFCDLSRYGFRGAARGETFEHKPGVHKSEWPPPSRLLGTLAFFMCCPHVLPHARRRSAQDYESWCFWGHRGWLLCHWCPPDIAQRVGVPVWKVLRYV